MSAKELNYGVIVMLEFYPSWLALPREKRRKLASDLYSILGKYSESVKVKFFDADAFGGGYTDFVICETGDLKQYHYMWEEIRDTVAYSQGYFKIKDVIMGIQNAYQSFETEVLKMDNDKRNG
jgi:hypothetical protein